MRIAALMAMAAVSWAGPAGWETEPKVTVCVDKGDYAVVVEQAQKVAPKMFARIHVKLEWHGDGAFCRVPGGKVIVV